MKLFELVSRRGKVNKIVVNSVAMVSDIDCTRRWYWPFKTEYYFNVYTSGGPVSFMRFDRVTVEHTRDQLLRAINQV